MAEPYLITGFDEVHPRLEIHELHKNTEQFTLFIFALIEIQKRDYMPNAASFQELSGIHGRPYERWSGDPNVPKNDGPKGWGGYCTHKSVLFPSWHRPVILAMEQSINAAAVKLADEWTKPPHVLESVRQSWKTAARQLRFPFWDWTDPRVKTEGIPNILRPQELKLSIPGVISKQVVDNPLAGYFFASGPVAGAENKQDPDTKKDRGFHKEWLRTCRRPSNSAIMPSEDYVTMNTLLSEGLSSRQIEVGRLFCYLAPDDIAKNQQPLIWDEFSNTDPIDPKKTGWPRQNLGSIELPHNSMHNTIGGWGAMGDTDYAAFDPIFYLHHCNMDRILAFWEHTYNKYWLGDGYRKKDGDGTLLHFKQLGGTWSQDEKVIITQSSPLQPFRTASGEYWTPSHARFLKDANSKYKFGYTYPDIVQTINGEDKTVSLNDPLPDSNEEVNRCKEVLQRHFGFPEPRPGKVDLGDDKDLTYANYRRFHLAVELVEHAFGGSYSLELVFRGKVVASFDVFARADSTQCAACRAGRAEGGFIREDVVKKNLAELEELPVENRLERIAHHLQRVVLVRMVDVGGDIRAYVLGRPRYASEEVPSEDVESSAPPSDTQPSAVASKPPWFVDPSTGPPRGAPQGVPLEKSIVPKLNFLASRAFKGKTEGEDTGEVGFDAPEKLGKYIVHDDHWRVFDV